MYYITKVTLYQLSYWGRFSNSFKEFFSIKVLRFLKNYFFIIFKKIKRRKANKKPKEINPNIIDKIKKKSKFMLFSILNDKL